MAVRLRQLGALLALGLKNGGKPDMGSWYQDMEAFASPAPLSKPRVTLTGSHRERFTDPGIESIEWNLKIYRTIDCATHPGC